MDPFALMRWLGWLSAYLDNNQPAIARAIWLTNMKAIQAFSEGLRSYYR